MPRRLARYAHPAVVGLSLLAGSACARDGWTPPEVVRVQSNEDVTTVLPAWPAWVVVGDDGASGALLLNDGDFLLAGDDFAIRYRASDGPSLVVNVTDSDLRFGNTVIAVHVSGDDDDEAVGWLARATPRELAGIRTLVIDDEISGAARPALQRLAAHAPGLDLIVGNRATLPELLSWFRPRGLFYTADDDEDGAIAPDVLEGHPQIDTLLVDASERGSLDVLSRLPNLRTLWLNEWDFGAAGALPAGLTQLRALQIVEPTGLPDLQTLSRLHLEQLALWTDDPVSLAGIEAMSSLRTLHLIDEHLEDLEPLARLANLRSIRVPSELRPAAFAAFVRTHPQLVILDLIGNLTLSDLTPVGELTHLEGLVIDGPVDHLDAIRSLTSLRYVGISKKLWDTNPDEVDAIRKALPDAVVVRVSPLCLGSGWVVVVVLAPLAMRGWRRWRALRARSR